MSNHVLAANGSADIDVSGRYVFIQSATGAVLVRGTMQDGTIEEVEMNDQDQVEFADRLRSITLVDNSGASNTVVLKVGLVRYIPRTDAGTVSVTGTVTTSGLTDTQLRATAVPVSGPVTDAQIRATPVPVSGPLTDAQMRATAVPVSGPATDAQMRATALPVSGPLTDAQMRATAVPVAPTVSATFNAPAALVPTAGGGSIPANGARRGVYVFAPAGNALAISMAATAGLGIPIAPGTFFPMLIETTAAIPFVAGNGTDVINYVEV